MKRIKWLVAGCMLLSGLFLNSCSKKESPSKAANPVPAATKKTAVAEMTAGELHNFFLKEYFNEYGRANTVTGTINATEFHLILSRLTQIAIEHGIFILDNPQQFTDAVFNDFVDQKFFDANGALKDEAALAALGSEWIQNPAVRSAFADIDALNYNDNNYIAEVNARLSLLTDLDEKDQQLVKGFRSVVNASVQFWENDPILYPMGTGKINAAVMADGRGFKEGIGEAMDGWGYIISLWGFATYRSAARSIAAIY